jgi:hypothetical protein
MAMVFNATFNNISVISWRSVLLMEETGETHRNVGSQWQTLSHNVVLSSTPHNFIGTDYIGSCKCNYHTITTILENEYKITSSCARLVT